MAQMTDQELIEAAAKADGLVGRSVVSSQGICFYVPKDLDDPHSENMIYCWLQDDGDALRLAIRLWLEIRVFNGKAHVGKRDKFWCTEDVGNDAYKATRRAIVRAAAEVSRF